jgi:hypothetical protein
MSKYKTCPLLSLSLPAIQHMGVNNNTVLCQEDECAWWDKQNECCIVHALSCLNK